MLILIIIAVILITILVLYNNLVKARNLVKQAESGIDVYLNQRFDLIPNLVETVKAYAKYEKETITRIVEIRSAYMQKENRDLKDASYMNSEFNNFIGVAESIPELKASRNFLNLQKTLIKLESQLQAARRIYNGDVTLYNTKITTFPGNIYANFFNFKEEELFEIEEYKRENPMSR